MESPPARRRAAVHFSAERRRRLHGQKPRRHSHGRRRFRSLLPPPLHAIGRPPRSSLFTTVATAPLRSAATPSVFVVGVATAVRPRHCRGKLRQQLLLTTIAVAVAICVGGTATSAAAVVECCMPPLTPNPSAVAVATSPLRHCRRRRVRNRAEAPPLPSSPSGFAVQRRRLRGSHMQSFGHVFLHPTTPGVTSIFETIYEMRILEG